MAAKNLKDLFIHTLKDVYYAETAITKALPKMAKAASSDDLRKAFEKHLKQTAGQITRLERVFQILGMKPAAVPCEAIKGILKEGDEVVEEFEGSPALDAGLIAAAQAVEHYEIARYGTLKCWASELGMEGAAHLLEQTLNEEKSTDEALTGLAESSVNAAAETEDEEAETPKKARRHA